MACSPTTWCAVCFHWRASGKFPIFVVKSLCAWHDLDRAFCGALRAESHSVMGHSLWTFILFSFVRCLIRVPLWLTSHSWSLQHNGTPAEQEVLSCRHINSVKQEALWITSRHWPYHEITSAIKTSSFTYCIKKSPSSRTFQQFFTNTVICLDINTRQRHYL